MKRKKIITIAIVACCTLALFGAYMIDGIFNTSYGQNAGYESSGNYNASFGYLSGAYMQNCNSNVFFGIGAGYGITNCNNCIGIGDFAMRGITNINNSIFIGSFSDNFLKNYTYSFFMEHQAVPILCKTNNVILIGNDNNFIKLDDEGFYVSNENIWVRQNLYKIGDIGFQHFEYRLLSQFEDFRNMYYEDLETCNLELSELRNALTSLSNRVSELESRLTPAQ